MELFVVHDELSWIIKINEFKSWQTPWQWNHLIVLSKVNKHCAECRVFEDTDFVAALVGALEESDGMLTLLMLQFQTPLVFVIYKMIAL